jgi:hypothetical protein
MGRDGRGLPRGGRVRRTRNQIRRQKASVGHCTLLQTLHCPVIIELSMLQIYTQRLWYRMNATFLMHHLQGTLSFLYIDPFLHAPVLLLIYFEHITLQSWIILKTAAATQAKNLDHLSLVRNRATFSRFQILLQMVS